VVVTKITERCFEVTGHTTFICDFSPPREGNPELLKQANIDADFISVAYNPGRAVRVNSMMLAAAIKQQLGKDVVFTLATRDMNKLALQSQLLGAQLAGLENVIIVQGDPFTERDLARVKNVGDFRPTGLIAAIAAMNQGVDFRDSRLRAPTDFCIGAAADLSRGAQQEARLAHQKAQAGAQFFITQPIFDPAEAERFHDAYSSVAGGPLRLPVFFGLQVLEQDGVLFSSVPESVREELAGGRSGVEVALELYQRFQERGLHNVYLVPPIRRGGARNYAAAQQVLAAMPRV
jgi:5,10-methylenetetrahydrofolate reductase